jgi:hypothetical protein
MGEQLKTKKAQVSMEFVFLIGLAFMVMVVFVSATRSEFSALSSEEERGLVKDLGVMIQHELILSSNVEDGYTRNFEIPLTLEEISFNMEITNNVLVVYTDDYESVLNIPSVNGSLQKGNNVIRKIDGAIYLN